MRRNRPFLAVLLVASAAIVPGSAAVAQGDVCALVTPDEVVHAVGTSATLAATPSGSGCLWQSSDAIIIGVWDKPLDQIAADGQATPVDVGGRQALYTASTKTLDTDLGVGVLGLTALRLPAGTDPQGALTAIAGMALTASASAAPTGLTGLPTTFGGKPLLKVDAGTLESIGLSDRLGPVFAGGLTASGLTAADVIFEGHEFPGVSDADTIGVYRFVFPGADPVVVAALVQPMASAFSSTTSEVDHDGRTLTAGNNYWWIASGDTIWMADATEDLVSEFLSYVP